MYSHGTWLEPSNTPQNLRADHRRTALSVHLSLEVIPLRFVFTLLSPCFYALSIIGYVRVARFCHTSIIAAPRTLHEC